MTAPTLTALLARLDALTADRTRYWYSLKRRRSQIAAVPYEVYVEDVPEGRHWTATGPTLADAIAAALVAWDREGAG
jgi:hypothetical protein